MPRSAEARYAIKADDQTAQGLRSATGRLRRFRDGIRNTLGRGLRTLAGPLAVVSGTIAGWAAGILKVAGGLDDLAKSAKDIGETVETTAELELAAKLLGTRPERLIRLLGRVDTLLVEAADGGKEASDAFAGLGVNVDAMLALSGPERLVALARAAGELPEELRRGRLAQVVGQGRQIQRLFADVEALEAALGRADLLQIGRNFDSVASDGERLGDALSEIGAQLFEISANAAQLDAFANVAEMASGALASARGIQGNGPPAGEGPLRQAAINAALVPAKQDTTNELLGQMLSELRNAGGLR